jgi:hypothetical protein
MKARRKRWANTAIIQHWKHRHAAAHAALYAHVLNEAAIRLTRCQASVCHI